MFTPFFHGAGSQYDTYIVPIYMLFYVLLSTVCPALLLVLTCRAGLMNDHPLPALLNDCCEVIILTFLEHEKFMSLCIESRMER